MIACRRHANVLTDRCAESSIVQPLEDLPRVKRAKIQFTIEKPDEEAEEVRQPWSSCSKLQPS